MNNEIEFIKLDKISEICKFPDSTNLGLFDTLGPKEAIYVPRTIFKDYIVSEVAKQSDLSGYLISHIHEYFLLDYVCLLLNSGAFRYEHLKANSPLVSLNISLSSLKNFVIPKIDSTLQARLSHISNQFFLYKNAQASENDRYFEVKASFFRMLCDSMVFQLYHSDLFVENNIDLIGHIDILFPDNSFLDFESMFNILSSQSNALIDNAKAFTHYFVSLSEKHKK